MKNKLKISILLAIIVGTPLLAIYKPGIGLIAGGIFLAMFMVYALLFAPNDNSFDILTDPGCSTVPGNIFYKEHRD